MERALENTFWRKDQEGKSELQAGLLDRAFGILNSEANVVVLCVVGELPEAGVGGQWVGVHVGVPGPLSLLRGMIYNTGCETAVFNPLTRDPDG